jgi:hypothetical protein
MEKTGQKRRIGTVAADAASELLSPDGAGHGQAG